MATYSVINLSKLEGVKRIDAEFYNPNYFIDFSKGNWKHVKNFLEICQYGISQAMTEEPKGYSIFRMDDIKGCFLLDDEVKYLELPEQVFLQYKLEMNDILFNRVNSEEFVGRTGIFKLAGDYVFASYLIRLRLKPNSEILPGYLNIFMNTKYGIKQIRRFSRRAVNQANVNAEELKNFKICVISLEIQQHICRLLDEAWKQIVLSKSLYFQAKTFLLEELGLKDFKPNYKNSYTANLSDVFTASRMDAEYFQPAYDEVIEKIKKYPNGFGKLLKYVENVKPNFDPTKNPEQIFPYIELSNIDPSIGVIQSISKTKGDEAPSRARRVLKESDVIVSSIEGSLEKVALVDTDHNGSLASTGFFQFRSTNIRPEVLLIISKTIILQSQLKKQCSGTILTAVPKESLRNIIIPLLPPSAQQKIASFIQQSHLARKKAGELLEVAKMAVEIAIEKDEKNALNYISSESSSFF
jgi:restriction endonuclease S subunit